MSILSPTTNDIQLIANSEKLRSDKDLEDVKLDDYLNDDSLSMNKNMPQFGIGAADDNNDIIGNVLKEETNKVSDELTPPADIGNTIDLSSGNSETFQPPEELDEYQRASDIEKGRMKYILLRKLADLAATNHLVLFKNYTLNDDYYDIKREYEYHTGERAKKMTVRNATSWTIQGVGVLELISKHYQLFGINLSGWKDNVEQRKEELICVISDLYDKYNITQSETSPEIRFLMLLGTTAFTTAFSNYTSKYVSSMFGGGRNEIKNIEIDATRQSIIDDNLKRDNQEVNQSDQDIYNQINEEASTETKMIQQQNLKTEQIRKGNYDINKKFEAELINRGLQNAYNKKDTNDSQPDMEPPNISDVPDIISFTKKEKKEKPLFRPKTPKK